MFGTYKSLRFMDYPDHMISRDGIVFRKYPDGWRRLTPVKIGRYLSIKLCYDGREKIFRIHRLVLCAFVGPCPDGMEGCHNDGNRLNNNAGNLRWDTRKANAADAVKHGTDSRGERHGNAKLSDVKVIELLQLWATGKYTKAGLARIFGVTRRIIQLVVTRQSWTHLEVG